MICARLGCKPEPVRNVEGHGDVHRRAGRPEQRDGDRQRDVGDLLADPQRRRGGEHRRQARQATSGSRSQPPAAGSCALANCAGGMRPSKDGQRIGGERDEDADDRDQHDVMAKAGERRAARRGPDDEAQARTRRAARSTSTHPMMTRSASPTASKKVDERRAARSPEMKPSASANSTEKTTSGRMSPFAAARTTLSGITPLKNSAMPGSGVGALFSIPASARLQTRSRCSRQREQLRQKQDHHRAEDRRGGADDRRSTGPTDRRSARACAASRALGDAGDQQARRPAG